MTRQAIVKVVVSVAGIALFQWGTSYQGNPSAGVLAHFAVISVAVGSYLLGLFQQRPS